MSMVTRSPAALPTMPVPLRTTRVVPHNLPSRISSFVGRDAEIAALGTLLTETRLLTLAGAGGAGKTRLPLQVAGTALPSFPDGVWFVDLAPMPDPATVAQGIALALRLPDEPGRATVETLLDALRARAVLLVLDNCEQVVAACAGLAERLLSACPRLRILATSREVLNVAGELIWMVTPLT